MAFFILKLVFTAPPPSVETPASDTIGAYSPSSSPRVSLVNTTAEAKATSNDIFRDIIDSGVDYIERFSSTPIPRLYRLVATPIPNGFTNPETDYRHIMLSFDWGRIKTLHLESGSTLGEWQFPTIVHGGMSHDYLTYDYDDVKLSPTDAIGDLIEAGYPATFESMLVSVPRFVTPEGDIGILHTFIQSSPPLFAVVVEDIDGSVHPVQRNLGLGSE